jgi:uncharacterized protein (DUF2164 family)
MDLKLERPKKLELVRDLQEYLHSEMELDPGDLSTELLLDFVTELITPHIYNQALFDARAVASRQADVMQEALLELERVPKARR